MRKEQGQQQIDFHTQVASLSAQNAVLQEQNAGCAELEAQLQHSQEELERTKTLLRESEKESNGKGWNLIHARSIIKTHEDTIETLNKNIQKLEDQAKSKRGALWRKAVQLQLREVEIQKLNKGIHDRDAKIDRFERARRAMNEAVEENDG